MALTEGTKLGRYEIRSLIGVGGMGEVYRASDPKIGRDVAIKVLPADFSADQERVARFEQEAQAAGALNHPNILAIYDVDSQDGVLYVVSELLEGEELRDRLDHSSIPLRKAIDYAQQIVSGLSAAHERRIVHRDLKPENLFITKDERVKILDFGLAKLGERSTNMHGSEDATRKALTNPGVIMGTAGYMSPEQVRGHLVDHRSDIFSFGVILYEMITGRRAFQHETMAETMSAILKEEPPEITESNPNISPSLERIIHRCLEKKPERRFQTASDLGFALESLAAPTSSSGATRRKLPPHSTTQTSRTSTKIGESDGVNFIAMEFIDGQTLREKIHQKRTELRKLLRFLQHTPKVWLQLVSGFVLGRALHWTPDGRSLACIVTRDGVSNIWSLPIEGGATACVVLFRKRRPRLRSVIRTLHSFTKLVRVAARTSSPWNSLTASPCARRYIRSEPNSKRCSATCNTRLRA